MLYHVKILLGCMFGSFVLLNRLVFNEEIHGEARAYLTMPLSHWYPLPGASADLGCLFLGGSSLCVSEAVRCQVSWMGREPGMGKVMVKSR